MTSPGRASSSAPCKSPPGATLMRRPEDGRSFVSRMTRGNSGGPLSFAAAASPRPPLARAPTSPEALADPSAAQPPQRKSTANARPETLIDVLGIERHRTAGCLIVRYVGAPCSIGIIHARSLRRRPAISSPYVPTIAWPTPAGAWRNAWILHSERRAFSNGVLHARQNDDESRQSCPYRTATARARVL